MAAKNLAVVTDGEIIIYGDALNPTSANIIAHVALGSRRTTDAYTTALNLAGWSTTHPWGWRETANGVVPAVPVMRH